MSTTLAEIAAKAGVSLATASRVINGKPGVSEEKRKKVLDVAQELGFATERLQHSDIRYVALIAPGLLDPVIARYMTAIGPLLMQRNCLTITGTGIDSGVFEREFLTMLRSQPIVGAIFVGSRWKTKEDTDAWQLLSDMSIPMVFINADASDSNAVCVGTDNRIAMTMALQHLYTLGHRSIGLVMGSRDAYGAQARIEAAQDFYAQHDMPYRENMTIWAPNGVESGRISARVLFERGATAVVCSSDTLAMGAIRAANSLGLRVPEDVSIVGYDDSVMMGSMIPSLTTIRQPVDRISRFSVEGLITMVDDPSTRRKYRDLMFEPELIVRESTGICP